jgi:hypothetical protein
MFDFLFGHKGDKSGIDCDSKSLPQDIVNLIKRESVDSGVQQIHRCATYRAGQRADEQTSVWGWMNWNTGRGKYNDVESLNRRDMRIALFTPVEEGELSRAVWDLFRSEREKH